MTALKDIVFETDRHWVKRVPKGFEVYKIGLTHSTRVASIGYTGDKGLQRAKAEIARREGSAASPSPRHHATKKSPAQLQREIDEVLASPGSYSYEEAMAALEKKHAGVKRGGSLRAGHAPVVPKTKEAHAEDLDRQIAPTLGKSRAQIVRAINAITRAADGRNVYLLRERLGTSEVRRVTRARAKGRGMEVYLLDSGNWIGVLPELGDRIDVR